MKVYTIIKIRAIIILTFSLIVLIPTGQNVGIDLNGHNALPFASSNSHINLNFRKKAVFFE